MSAVAGGMEHAAAAESVSDSATLRTVVAVPALTHSRTCKPVTLYHCILIRKSIIHIKFCIIVLNFIYLNYQSSYRTLTDIVFHLEDLFEGFIFII